MTFRISEYFIEDEIWKPIPFYKGLYEASNLGRIRSVDGKTTHSVRHGVRKWKGRVLKNKTKVVNKKTGYRISLWKDKKSKEWLVCRLVALAFYGIPKDFNNKDLKKRMTINHIDGNRLNNKVENLEWVTLKKNIQHAFGTGLVGTNHKIGLIDQSGIYKEFISKSKASIYLNKNVGYISCLLKRKDNIAYDKNKNKYKVIEVKE